MVLLTFLCYAMCWENDSARALGQKQNVDEWVLCLHANLNNESMNVITEP